MEVSTNIHDLETETAFSILAKANELKSKGHDIINLGIGQPDFPTPTNIVEAAIKALKDGHHGYTPSNGILELREAVCRFIHKNYNIEINPDNIDAFYAIATSGKKLMSPDEIQKFEKLLISPFITSDKKVKINFALAWQADQRELPVPAITFCAAGNNLRKKLLATKGYTFDPIAHQELVERVKNVYTEDFFKDRISFSTEESSFSISSSNFIFFSSISLANFF